MIDAKELRIGNWVINDCTDKEFQVSGADILQATFDEDWLLPISITEDWLLRFGFKVVMRKGEYITYSNRKNRIGMYSGYYIMRGHGVKFNYVHQLQNLYFALTGVELEKKQS